MAYAIIALSFISDKTTWLYDFVGGRNGIAGGNWTL